MREKRVEVKLCCFTVARLGQLKNPIAPHASMGIEGEVVSNTMDMGMNVNLLGLLYHPIVRAFSREDRKSTKRSLEQSGTGRPIQCDQCETTETGYSRPVPIPADADIVSASLSKHFSKHSTTIHIDEAPTVEMQLEHDERQKQRTSQLERCCDLAEEFMDSRKGQREFWKRIVSCQGITEADKSALVSGLIDRCATARGKRTCASPISGRPV